MTNRDLEQDLNNSEEVKEKVIANENYARKLYAALCNIQWLTNEHNEDDKEDYWSCSWRYAGGLVSSLNTKDRDYMDYYCSGNEGHVDREVEKDLLKLGWRWREWT